MNSEIKDKQRKFISPYNTTTNKINFSKKIYCMMKKEPNLSQKSQKEHLVKIKWCMLEKSCFNLLLHIRNFPVIQKKYQKWISKNI